MSSTILYPLVLKFGTDKSDIFLILSGLVSCGMLILISGGVSLLTGEMNMKAPLVDLVSVSTALALFAASYFVSVRILRDKEFA